MQLLCGTSGFSFKEWKGPFYPPDLAAADMLRWYAGKLAAVEINNTFYRLPRKAVVAGWCEQVPPEFRFVVKASRRITHLKRLQDCEEPAGFLFAAVAGFGDRLGAVLFQLPPHMRADKDRLQAFLETIPASIPVAFEFRHPSWDNAEIRETLAQRNVAWVWADNDGSVPASLPKTASWTYLRLRADDYPAAKLAAWHGLLRDFDHAFVFFKHEADGAAPRLAREMQALTRASGGGSG